MITLVCLALNIYFEARGENPDAQLAVAEVTLNRGSPCKVVAEPHQFSWTTAPPPMTDPLLPALLMASQALSQPNQLLPSTATHYHDLSIEDPWGFPQIGKIGNFIFYEGDYRS